MTAPRSELRALTGTRGVAAWLVVLYHIRGSMPWLPTLLEPPVNHGYLSVDFFFILSGFVMWLSWGDRLYRDQWRVVPAFWRKRMARIWPLHALTLAVTIAIASVLVATGRANPIAFPFREIPLQLLLMQDWGFTDRLSWNVPSWSISAEMGAYLLFPIVVTALDWRKLPSTALVMLCAILLFSLSLVLSLSSIHGFDIPHFGWARCLFEFHIGAIVCLLWQRGGGWTQAWLIVLGAVGLWIVGAPETLAAPALFAAGVSLLASASDRHPLGRGWLHSLGDSSYATYLCHYPLWIAFKLAFVRDVNNVTPVLIAAYLAIVLVCATIAYRHFERPAQRFVERLGRTPEPATALR